MAESEKEPNVVTIANQACRVCYGQRYGQHVKLRIPPSFEVSAVLSHEPSVTAYNDVSSTFCFGLLFVSLFVISSMRLRVYVDGIVDISCMMLNFSNLYGKNVTHGLLEEVVAVFCFSSIPKSSRTFLKSGIRL